MQKLVTFVDSLAYIKGISPEDMIPFTELADSVVRKRFYYGLQNYRFDENYMANTLGKYLWSHFGAKVNPDHILKGQKAYCSQSSIVFQELLKEKKFNVRTVRLSNHFCTEVLINGNWSFHDVSYKPSFSHSPSLSTQELADNPGYLEEAYLYSFAENFRDNIHEQFNNGISYGEINAFAAPRMRLFHQLTWFLSWWGWAVFFGLGWVSFRFYGSKEV